MKTTSSLGAVTAVTLLAVCGGVSLTILAPIAADLMRLWSIDAAGLGLLNSAFAVSGVALALPGAWLVQRLGLRAAGLATLAFLAAGFLLALVSPALAVQVAARILQGTGQALVAVLGPLVIGRLVPAAQRGRAMGLYTTAVPIAMIVTFNTAPALLATGGAALPFAAAAGLAVVLVPVWWWAVPSENQAARTVGAQTFRWAEVLNQPSVVPTAVTMLLLAGAFLTLQMFNPVFLVQERGCEPGIAASLASLGAVSGLAASLFGGLVSDALGHRRRLALGSLGALAVLLAAIPLVPTAWVVAVIVVMGVMPALTSLNLLTLLTEQIAEPRLVGPALGVASLGQNIGLVVGPLAFGAALGPFGWTAGIEALAVTAGLGFLVLLGGTRKAPRP